MNLRLALRMLKGSPAFAAMTGGTIALAIALAAVVFAVVDGVLFKPLPYIDADRLFNVMGRAGTGPHSSCEVFSMASMRMNRWSGSSPRQR